MKPDETIFWMFAAIGGVGAFFCARWTYRRVRTRRWASTSGVVSAVSPDTKAAESLRYEFEIGGRNVKGSKYYPGCTPQNDRPFSIVRYAWSDLKPGQGIRIFYNPTAPGESFLEPEPFWRVPLAVLIAVFATLSAAFGLLMLILTAFAVIRSPRPSKKK